MQTVPSRVIWAPPVGVSRQNVNEAERNLAVCHAVGLTRHPVPMYERHGTSVFLRRRIMSY